MHQLSQAERAAFRRSREQAIAEFYQQFGLQPPARYRSETGFPFNLLEQGIKTLLRVVERSVERAVRKVLKDRR